MDFLIKVKFLRREDSSSGKFARKSYWKRKQLWRIAEEETVKCRTMDLVDSSSFEHFQEYESIANVGDKVENFVEDQIITKISRKHELNETGLEVNDSKVGLKVVGLPVKLKPMELKSSRSRIPEKLIEGKILHTVTVKFDQERPDTTIVMKGLFINLSKSNSSIGYYVCNGESYDKVCCPRKFDKNSNVDRLMVESSEIFDEVGESKVSSKMEISRSPSKEKQEVAGHVKFENLRNLRGSRKRAKMKI